METNLRFEPKNVDETSSIPNAHLSYIVQQLVPLRHIGRKRLDEFYENLNQNKDFERDDFLPVGSLAEGLNMPHIIIRKTGEEIRGDSYTDMDLMMIAPSKYRVTFEHSAMSTGNYYAFAETDRVHPGYVRLNLSTKSEEPQYKSREIIQLLMQLSVLKKDEKAEQSGINGPALTTIRRPWIKTNRDMVYRFPSTDMVLALPCSEWPPKAMDWLKRPRDQEWLGEQLVNSLVKDGCHIVPTFHRLSETPEIEWRISFAATERRIALEAITDNQRQVYIFIKLLYHQSLKELSTINSYHLKTILLYACELLPLSAWADHTGTCIFFFLDLLAECIKKKRLPHFFLPENNLFDYFSEEELQNLLQTLTAVRNNPISFALEFTKDKLISTASVQHSMETLMKPVTDDIKVYLQHEDIKRSILEAFVPATSKILITQLEERKNEEAVHVAKELHSLLLKYNMTEETFGEFCAWNIANHMTDGRMSVAFLEQVISMHDGDPDFDCCKNILPCLLHAASYRYPINSEQHKEYVRKADAAFLLRFNKKGISGGYCDYVLLLMKQNRIDDAVKWLDELIASNNDQFANMYDANEIMTLDEVLQSEIVEHNSFSAPSLSLAFYLKIDCCLMKNDKDSAITLLHKFKHHAEEMKLPRTYALLGYSYMGVGDWKSGSDAFKLAVESNTQMEYTRAVKMKRYCDNKIGQLLDEKE